MFQEWSDFYLVVGGAAAVLLGLIFVVVSLMNDRPRSAVLYGSKLYMGPIVLHMCFVLVLSAAAVTPGMSPRVYGAIALAIAVWGAARGVYSIVGLSRLRKIGEDEVHWTDVWYYGAVPLALYVAVGGVAAGFWSGWRDAPYALAAVIVALLLLSVRDEYDLVTWLAPRRDAETKGANSQNS
jgi:hypothetical protein